MHRFALRNQPTRLTALAVLGCLLVAVPVGAAKVTLTDGRILEGRLGMVAGLAEDPNAPSPSGGVDVQPILVIDTGLERFYVSKRRVRPPINEAAPAAVEKIPIPQHVAKSGLRIGGVGPIISVTPWDEFGRRIFTMKTHKGPVSIVQGITLVTPNYTKVEALRGHRSYIWEMRIATSSIPRETLGKILTHTIDRENSNERLKIVRLFIQSERYRDAREELESIVADFSHLSELKAEVRALRQMGARRLLREVEMRREGGQHGRVQRLLASFPGDGVAGETLQKVQQILGQYENERQRGDRVLKLFDENLAAIDDPALAEPLRKVREELERELGFNTLERMAAFLRLADDKTLSHEQKLALATSGWLMGSNDSLENLPLALSLYRLRDLVRGYLRERIEPERAALLQSLRNQEGASVANLAKLVAHMKPPRETEPPADETPGYHELLVPGPAGEGDTTYFVQLPPEYDPYRRYPVVVTLNGAGSSPEQQLDWWAGSPNEHGERMGQASRHGYIVLSVAWQKPYQVRYEYSGREHQGVMSCLRDACRRFAIDTDRVFLSGHSMGGDAAWDIGLAHPDVWAGVIPIVAVADRYCHHYWRHGRLVPMYVVAGELDGDKMTRNARDLDRLLIRGADTTVVEFLGRGHEHFHDEIQRLFDWMNRRHRDFYPKEIDCRAMRSWDNYFWWIEVSDLPAASVVDPADWPPRRGTRAGIVSGKVKKSSIFVKTAAARATVWLSPELIDFEQPISVSIKGRRVGGRATHIKPDLAVLLEDVRTRADRQHPFWARVDGPSGR